MFLNISIIYILISLPLFGYIDPGTGSLLFSALFGIIGTLFFLSKALLIKLKTISFGKNKSNILKQKAKIIIYGEDKRYYNLFKPIIEELIKLEIPTIYYSSSEDDPIFEIKNNLLHTEFIGPGNKAYAKLNFIEADICLMTTPNLDVFQLRRSKGVKKYVHIVHAPSETSLYCIYGLDFFDSVLLNGKNQISDIRELESIRNTKEKELKIVGSPYLDELLKKKEILSNSIEKNDNKKTILIAPSWGKNGLLYRFGEKLIDPILESGYHVIIRPHPQSFIVEQDILNGLKSRYETISNLEWDFNHDNIYSLIKSDVMLSDFSGIIFDYAFLFEKPTLIPTFTFDKRPYDAFELKSEIWTLTTLPKISIFIDENNFNSISNIIEDTINNNTLKNNIINVKKEAYMFIGEASKNVALYCKNTLNNINN